MSQIVERENDDIVDGWKRLIGRYFELFRHYRLRRVKLRSNGEGFINYLTFFRFQHGWRIVSKAYCRPS